MDNALTIAQQTLFASSDLDEAAISKTLSVLASKNIDNGDLYFQHSRHESWVLEDGIVKEGAFGIDQGVGVRAIKGEKTGFAYSDEIVLPALLDAGKAASSIAQTGNGKIQVWHKQQPHDLYTRNNPLTSLDAADKVELLHYIDKQARAKDKRIKQVISSLSGKHETILIAAVDGTFVADVRPLIRLNVTVIAEYNGRREQGSAGCGGRYGYLDLKQNSAADKLVEEAVRQALLNLEAVPAPAGKMTVVLGAGWPGVLLHEAVGHGLEGDAVRKGTSVFSNCLGERVAAAGVTIVDDGTLEARRGSLNIDDEGTLTQCTTLIEDGILKQFMQDKMNAHLMGVAPTGNGRRESYAHTPMPRMTNTYMRNGKHTPEEIIASVDKGFYAVNFSGGQVDITSGKFVFSASEAYLIENGKIGRPVKGATLIGDGADVLTRVTMIGNDLKLDDGIGTCGKNGQMVPVGVGQPSLRIDGITVGGTA